MVFQIILCLWLVGLVASLPANPPEFSPNERTYKEDQYKPESRPYKFDYGVRDDYSGANFGHQEDSDGNSIKGSYSVALPDGRIQKVTYVADHHNGFQAKVTYEGEASYDQPKKQEHKPQPHYKSAEPQYKFQQPRYKTSQSQYGAETQLNHQVSPPFPNFDAQLDSRNSPAGQSSEFQNQKPSSFQPVSRVHNFNDEGRSPPIYKPQ